MMADTPLDNVANRTLLHLRRIETTQKQMLEMLQRHDTQLGRIQRDLTEMKGDHYTFDSQMLNRMNEILRVTERLDEHELRLQQLERPAQGE